MHTIRIDNHRLYHSYYDFSGQFRDEALHFLHFTSVFYGQIVSFKTLPSQSPRLPNGGTRGKFTAVLRAAGSSHEVGQARPVQGASSRGAAAVIGCSGRVQRSGWGRRSSIKGRRGQPTHGGCGIRGINRDGNGDCNSQQ